jgi:hypothetical protein
MLKLLRHYIRGFAACRRCDPALSEGYIVPFPRAVPGEIRPACNVSASVCRQGMPQSVTLSNAVITGLNIYVAIRTVIELK